MSNEQLSQLISKLIEDKELQQKIKSAENLDAAVIVAREASLDVSSEDLLAYRVQEIQDLNDEELERVAGAYGASWFMSGGCCGYTVDQPKMSCKERC